MDFLNQNYGDM